MDIDKMVLDLSTRLAPLGVAVRYENGVIKMVLPRERIVGMLQSELLRHGELMILRDVKFDTQRNRMIVEVEIDINRLLLQRFNMMFGSFRLTEEGIVIEIPVKK